MTTAPAFAPSFIPTITEEARVTPVPVMVNSHADAVFAVALFAVVMVIFAPLLSCEVARVDHKATVTPSPANACPLVYSPIFDQVLPASSVTLATSL